jgi:hypothetical protein
VKPPENIQSDVLFGSDTRIGVICMLLWCACSLYACILIFYCLPAIDTNDNECTEEGGVFAYQGEEQGQAKKGKPSKLVASLIPVFTYA